MSLVRPLSHNSCREQNVSGQGSDSATIQIILAYRRSGHPSHLQLPQSSVENFRARCVVSL